MNGGMHADNSNRIRMDYGLNIGTLIHLCVLIVVIAFSWAAFDRRTTILELQVTEQGKQIIEIRKQTNRIERYLQGNDTLYWKKMKDNGGDSD